MAGHAYRNTIILQWEHAGARWQENFSVYSERLLVYKRTTHRLLTLPPRILRDERAVLRGGDAAALPAQTRPYGEHVQPRRVGEERVEVWPRLACKCMQVERLLHAVHRQFVSSL